MINGGEIKVATPGGSGARIDVENNSKVRKRPLSKSWVCSFRNERRDRCAIKGETNGPRFDRYRERERENSVDAERSLCPAVFLYARRIFSLRRHDDGAKV